MKIVSMVAHPITLVGNGKIIEIQPSGLVLRAPASREIMGYQSINGVNIPLVRVVYSKPSIPPLEEDAIYVVSRITAETVRWYYPEVAERFFVPMDPVRDFKGKVIGATILANVRYLR
jgi:hypothetical protein